MQTFLLNIFKFILHKEIIFNLLRNTFFRDNEKQISFWFPLNNPNSKFIVFE